MLIIFRLFVAQFFYFILNKLLSLILNKITYYVYVCPDLIRMCICMFISIIVFKNQNFNLLNRLFFTTCSTNFKYIDKNIKFTAY